MIKQTKLKEIAIEYLKKKDLSEVPSPSITLCIVDSDISGKTTTFICPHCGEVETITTPATRVIKCPSCGTLFNECVELDYNGTQTSLSRDYCDIVDFDVDNKWLIVAKMMVNYEITVPEIERGAPNEINLKRALKEAVKKPVKMYNCSAYIFSKELSISNYQKVGCKEVFAVSAGNEGVETYHMRNYGWFNSTKLKWLNSRKCTEFSDNDAQNKMGIIGMSSFEDISKSFAVEKKKDGKTNANSKKAATIEAENTLYLATENSDVKQLLLSNVSSPSAFEFNTTEKGTEYVIYCCGKRHVVLPNENGKIVCPICGEEKDSCRYYSYSNTEYDSYADVVLASDGNLVFNEYSVHKALPNITDPNGHITVSSIKKNSVTVSTAKGMIRYFASYGNDNTMNRNGNYSSSVRSVCGYWSGNRNHNINIMRGEEIEDIVSQSNFSNCGSDIYVEHCLNHSLKENNPSKKVNLLVNYLSNVTRIPICEFLVKQGLWDIYDHIVTMRQNDVPKFCKAKAPSIREAFGLSKKQAKILNREKLDVSHMFGMKKIMALDESVEWEDIKWVFDNYSINSSGDNDILRCMEKSGSRLKEVRAYLLSCLYNQAIKLNESPQLWCDYIAMMEKLKFSPEQMKKEMHPSSLKKSHDVLNFASINIFDKEKAKIFDENIEECKKFEYSFEDYFIKAPDAAEDLVKEGIALNHSVAQHIEYVADGQEYILFIRAKAAPDTSFYTVELLKNKSIVQIRGNSNKPVKEEAVLNFIHKWAKFKKLTIVSM